MRLRQRVHANLRGQGQHSCHRVTLPQGLCSDTGQHASLEEHEGGRLLVIRELPNVRVVSRWPLPSLPLESRIGYWCWGGTVLAAVCARTGVLLVDSTTGLCTSVALSPLRHWGDTLGGWSVTGCLLVQSTGADAVRIFSAVGAQGQLVASVALPCAEYTVREWAPDGHAVALGQL